MSAIREEAARLAEGGRLSAVLTRPSGAPSAAALLVTAGLTPKSGPFRLYAELARRLAAEGALVLRLDLGGIGDSVELSGLPLAERTNRDLRAAADFLREQVAAGPLVVGGLCSGADDALRYAVFDPRVTGVFMIDPFAFRTFGWRWRDALIRAARRALALSGVLPTAAPNEAGSLVDYAPMAEPEAREALSALAARGASMHFIYTGGARETFNHRGQFRAMLRGLDLRGLAALDYFPQLRHTQVLEADRLLIIDAIARRLRPGPSCGCPN